MNIQAQNLPSEPCDSIDPKIVITVAQALTDAAHDSIVCQHEITRTLIRRMGMIGEHISHLERLMNSENRLQYEGEHEQAMSEYRFLDAFIASVERSNDQAVDRMKGIQRMWGEEQ